MGHSLGAMSAFMLGADDDRIDMSIVPLDPVNPDEGWSYSEEAPGITAPMGLIGSPSHWCNWNARYNDIYPLVGPDHKAKFVIVGGNHGDFLDAENPLTSFLASLVCGGQFSEDRLRLIERYSAAWFNYYVHLDTDYYTYLYGEQAADDISAGLITRTVDTAPRGVRAEGRFGSVELDWSVYDHPIVAGYNIYRSQQGEGGYSDWASPAWTVEVTDTVRPPGVPVLLSPPDGTVTTTHTITFDWQAGEGSAPEGYNLDLDGNVITTTDTSWVTVLSSGVHSWTARAYNVAGASGWAVPRTLRVPGYHVYVPLVQRQAAVAEQSADRRGRRGVRGQGSAR